MFLQLTCDALHITSKDFWTAVDVDLDLFKSPHVRTVALFVSCILMSNSV